MNRATLPLNSDKVEEVVLCKMLTQSVQQSLKARLFSQTTTERHFILHDCIVVEDATKFYMTFPSLFQCKIAPEQQYEFLNATRNKSLHAFQKEGSEEAIHRYQLTKSIAEVLADDRHFHHLNRLFSAIYVNAESTRLCSFLTGSTWTQQVLLLNFEQSQYVSANVEQKKDDSEQNDAKKNTTILSLFFKQK